MYTGVHGATVHVDWLYMILCPCSFFLALSISTKCIAIHIRNIVLSNKAYHVTTEHM